MSELSSDGSALPAVTSATGLLTGWVAPDEGQDALRRHYLGLLERGVDALAKGAGPEHLTASALVFDAAVESVLLVHHAKGGFWVQPGGHWDPGDADLAATADRELREETGLAGVSLTLHDLDRHELSSAFGRCRAHCDVLFRGRVTSRPQLRVSAESHAVQWFRIDALPDGIIGDLPPRIRAAAAAALGQPVSALDQLGSEGSSTASGGAEAPSRM